MASCYPGFDLAPPAPPTRNAPAPHKDYTRPLHVDCSVEYELPNQAKPPEGARSEPLLMIHPCYYRRAESQRRSPFINNLPTRTQSMVTVGGRRASQVPRLVQQQQQQQTAVSIQQPQHQTQQYQVQAVRYLDPSGRPEATTMLHQQQQQHHQHMAVTNWNQMDASLVAAPAPVPVYSKPSVAAVKHMKRDPMLCRGGDFSSGSDSGVSVSAGHWTDSDRSPLAPELRLQRDFTATTDSGIGTPVDDKAVLSDGVVRTGGVDQRNRRLMSTVSYTGFNSYGIPNRVELIRYLKPDNLELIQFLKLAKTNTNKAAPVGTQLDVRLIYFASDGEVEIQITVESTDCFAFYSKKVKEDGRDSYRPSILNGSPTPFALRMREYKETTFRFANARQLVFLLRMRLQGYLPRTVGRADKGVSLVSIRGFGGGNERGEQGWYIEKEQGNGRPPGPLSHVLEQRVLVAPVTGRCSGKSHPINDTTYRAAPCPIVAHLAKTPHGAHSGPESLWTL
uniref:Uncharacterized protein n=1 Tax=Timema tahoe TaxID=61484 RepID=A0A7R9IJ95_9NEOP|nr:unnamed protein product [Timema tahoe]